MIIRTKICGITSTDDALQACSAGADAIGLVFYEKSPRHVTTQQALDILRVIPPFVTTVGLFLNAKPQTVHDVLSALSLDLLQFHGTETADYCRSFSRPYIKAVGMKGLSSFEEYSAPYKDAKGFLVDSHTIGEAGGSGETFDWQQIPQSSRPIILAGGLNPDNVSQALSTAKQADIRLYGVDISSGVELKPGVKDSDKVNRFIAAVRRADGKI